MNHRAVVRRPGWLAMLVVLLATMAASALSFGITITALHVAPVLLTTAVGTALMARMGRGTWPAMLVGDTLGQVAVGHGSIWLVLATSVLHLLVALAGATWVVHHDAWPQDLRSSMRYVIGAVVLSAVAGVGFACLVHAVGLPIPGHALLEDTLWASVGMLVGFLVAGGALLAWLRPGAGPLRVGWPVAGLVAVTVAAFAGLAGPLAIAVPIAMLGTMLLTARAGRRWGFAALVVAAALSLVGADRGVAPFGGTTTTGALTNVMLALGLFGGLTILLGGYRESGQGTRHTVATTALLFAGMMLVAGVAGVVSNDVVISQDSPLVVAGFFTAATTVGLIILRSARPVTTAPGRRGVSYAVAAGALYALNLALLFTAMPLVGAGAATALAMISPLPVVVLSVIFLRLRPSWLVVGATGIIVMGAVVAALGSLDSPSGLTLALLSAVAFGASVICTRKALLNAGIIDVALASAASAAVVSLVAGAIVDGPAALLLSEQEIRIIALAALGAQLIPMLGRTWALEYMGADLVGAEGVLAPATTALLSFWFISPPSAASQVVGLVVIAVGGVLAALAGTSRKSPHRTA